MAENDQGRKDLSCMHETKIIITIITYITTQDCMTWPCYTHPLILLIYN